MPAPGDVTDEAAVQLYVGDVLERSGRIDILVNNAALLGDRGRGRRERGILRAGRAGLRAGLLPQHQARGPVDGRARDQGLDHLHLLLERLDLVAAHHRLRVQQGRG
jgi:NAD(P)-dependent dehydrogenase (short-subunit alcohol dehydrogenase family)